MTFNSIRAKIQIWYGLILAVLLLAFGTTAFQLERGRRIRKIDDELLARLNTLAPSMRPGPERRGGFGFGPGPGPRRGGGPEAGIPPDLAEANPPPGFEEPRGDRRGRPPGFRPEDFRLNPRQRNLFDESDTNSFYFIIWTREDRELARSTNAPAGLAKPVVTPPGPIFRFRDAYREAAAGGRSGEVVLTGRSIADELTELQWTKIWLAAIGSGVVLVGLAGGWWISSRAIKPIDEISATAVKIASGDLTQRIPVAETGSELGRLTSVLNATFDRLATAFTHQARFSSDTAHELRTPVAVMLTQTQSALARERPAGEYREALESCQRAAQRMRKLIEQLLELARFDAGQQPLNLRTVALDEILIDAADALRPLAEQRQVSMQLEVFPLALQADPDRLLQVASNLIGNAVYYNKPGGTITIRLGETEGLAWFSVEDTGLGIKDEDRALLFERFFRADKSRTSHDGRTGLGLAISLAIVVAHGGTIDVESKVNEGSRFTVRLPKNSKPERA